MTTETVTTIATPRAEGSGLRGYFVQLFANERDFLVVLLVGFLVAALAQGTPALAMWVGFAFAAYSAVANDSIQTIGTFIASNRGQKWWVLWLFIGGIFLVTVTYSFVTYDGDVTFQRLASKGFSETPTSFSYLQLAAPLLLLILTRMRMPVSTTFLLLTSFATSASSVGDVLGKSVLGWVVAFGVSFVVWGAASKAMQRWFVGDAHPAWRVGQWLTSGLLWSVWIMQDASNIAVYLPRQMSGWELGGFALVVFFGLGLLFKKGGERIQKVVDEKSDVVDVRAATVIDLVYAAILYYFKVHSEIPMSTTWVFVGLLGGRELSMALRKTSGGTLRDALRLMFKDLAFVTLGLLVSLVLAYSVNQAFRTEVNAMVGM